MNERLQQKLYEQNERNHFGGWLVHWSPLGFREVTMRQEDLRNLHMQCYEARHLQAKLLVVDEEHVGWKFIQAMLQLFMSEEGDLLVSGPEIGQRVLVGPGRALTQDAFGWLQGDFSRGLIFSDARAHLMMSLDRTTYKQRTYYNAFFLDRTAETGLEFGFDD